jgi:putative ABC transport system ATP-binding protein
MSAVTSTAPVYELSEVCRTFRRGDVEVRALDGIDLRVEAGEFLAVQGTSGSGKTTLLQLLGGLERCTAGTLLFDGRELSRLGDRQLTRVRARDIGFVFQQFNLIPTLTAAENVEAALATDGHGRRARRTRAAEVLDQVGLAARRQHLPSTLSGGEQQRVAIARALANQPRVLLADEPTGNLDSSTTDEVMEVLRRLSLDSDLTIVLVTHADEVAARASRIVHVSDGRIVRRPDRAGRQRDVTTPPGIAAEGVTRRSSVDATMTDGVYTVDEVTYGPGAAEDVDGATGAVTYRVVGGTLSVDVSGTTQEATVSEVVVVPSGAPHRVLAGDNGAQAVVIRPAGAPRRFSPARRG